jgi:hypothetical protein
MRIPAQRGRALCASIAISAAVALTGCSGSTQASVANVGSSSTPAPSSSIPTAAELRSALLTADDLGPSFSVQPSETATPTPSGGQATGCKQLTDLINSPAATASPTDQTVETQVILFGGDTGPYVGEFLSGSPSAKLDKSFPVVKSALESCKQLNLPSGSTQISFALSPIDFGSPGSVARQMDGSVEGVPVNGYIAVNRLSSTVAFVYLYIQVGSSSPQQASAFYHQALTKAQNALRLNASAGSV